MKTIFVVIKWGSSAMSAGANPMNLIVPYAKMHYPSTLFLDFYVPKTLRNAISLASTQNKGVSTVDAARNQLII
jgi:hypothetical protein